MKKYRIDIPLGISLPLIVEAESEEQAYYQAWHEMEVIQKACLSGFEALKGLVEGFGRAEMLDKARIEEFVKEREGVSKEQEKEMNKKIELYGDGIGSIEYVSHMGTDLTVVNAARVSLGKKKEELDQRGEKLINYLIKHRHTSTLEHNVVTFRFKVPLYVRSQHHRHRTWCLSGDTEITFNRPDRWRKGQHCKQSPWRKGGFTIAELYRKWNTKIGKKRIENQLVRVYDEKEKKFSVSNICDVMYSGKKDVFKVTLENGKEIKSSKDHLFLTSEGWQTLEKAIGLDMSKNKKATFSKDSFFLTNGTNDLWRSYDWMKKKREEGLSVSEIAEEAKCSYHNIRKWLKVHDLQFDQVEVMLKHNRINGPWNKGKKGYKANKKPITKEHREAIIKSRSGENSNFWKGGVSPERSKIARWTTDNAKNVHAKYGYTCQECEQRGGKLHAHHVKSVVEFPEHAYDFDNLVTVCAPCHYKIHHGKEMSRSKKGTPLAGIYSKVVKVEYVGEEETFDLSISGDNHNFVANGIVVHNSYNEISRRYTEENLEFYEPKSFRTQHKNNRQASNQEGLISPRVLGEEFNYSGEHEIISAYVGVSNPYLDMAELNEAHHQWCLYLYNFMMEKGVCREQARGVLPQNLYTEYYGTVNLNNLMKFISLRTHEGAQWEIQKVAEACLKIAKQLWPVTVDAYERNKK